MFLVNRLLEFNQLFDGDGLPNLTSMNLKQVYEAHPDYPKKVIRLPSELEQRVQAVKAIDEADLWRYIHIDYLDDFQSFVSSLIRIQTKNETILSGVLEDYCSRRLQCKDNPFRDYLMTTKPDWVLTKTFNLFLERWKPKPSHKHVSKFRCELQSVLSRLTT